MEISLEKFLRACKEVGLTEDTVIQLIEKIYGLNRLTKVESDPKNIPMKVENNYTWGNHDQRPDGNCPVCKCDLSGTKDTPKYERCPNCRQKLDWH